MKHYSIEIPDSRMNELMDEAYTLLKKISNNQYDFFDLWSSFGMPIFRPHGTLLEQITDVLVFKEMLNELFGTEHVSTIVNDIIFEECGKVPVSFEWSPKRQPETCSTIMELDFIFWEDKYDNLQG